MKWTENLCLKEANKFKTRRDFQNKSPGAYHWLLRHDMLSLLDNIIPLRRKKWTEDEVKILIKKYKTASDFRKANAGAYFFIMKNFPELLKTFFPKTKKTFGRSKENILGKSKGDSYVNSTKKQEHRDRLRDLLRQKSTGRKDVFTLAGINMIDARMYGNQKCSVFSAEKSKDIHSEQLPEISEYPYINAFNTDTLSFFKNDLFSKKHFDMIYLDYCGSYTLDKEDTIKQIFKNKNLQKGDLFALTFELTRERNDKDGEKHLKQTDLYKVTCCEDLEEYFNNRDGIIKAAIGHFAREEGIHLKEVFSEVYRNKDTSPNMLFVVYRI